MAAHHGILNPHAGAAKFTLARYPPCAALAGLVERYWVVRWDLDEPFAQETLPHPAVNLVIGDHQPGVFGPPRARFVAQLTGAGCVLGAKFLPGGFYPFLHRDVASLAGTSRTIADVFGPAVAARLDATAVRLRSGTPAAPSTQLAASPAPLAAAPGFRASAIASDDSAESRAHAVAAAGDASSTPRGPAPLAPPDARCSPPDPEAPTTTTVTALAATIPATAAPPWTTSAEVPPAAPAAALDLACVAELEAVLLGLEPLADPNVAIATQAVALAQRDPRLARTADLAARTGLSPRSLERLFRRYVGVSPKWVIRRFRIIEACERAKTGVAPVWTQLADELGYFDQAHFIRDFKAQVGRTPTDYAAACALAVAAAGPGHP